MTKIAIIEDSQVIRQSLETIVNQAPGFGCVCACATGEEALELVPRHAPDVVLMDIQLPGMSGIECTARLKQVLPSLQIVMVTVYEDTDRILKALRAGACGYLLKRSTPEQIVAAIREVQQGGAPMTGGVARRVVASLQEPAPGEANLPNLSAREREILALVADGRADKEIAQHLGVSNWTVYWHLKNIYAKLHVRSRTQAVLKFRPANSSPGPPPTNFSG